jgi:hypothetical protein
MKGTSNTRIIFVGNPLGIPKEWEYIKANRRERDRKGCNWLSHNGDNCEAWWMAVSGYVRRKNNGAYGVNHSDHSVNAVRWAIIFKTVCTKFRNFNIRNMSSCTRLNSRMRTTFLARPLWRCLDTYYSLHIRYQTNHTELNATQESKTFGTYKLWARNL